MCSLAMPRLDDPQVALLGSDSTVWNGGAMNGFRGRRLSRIPAVLSCVVVAVLLLTACGGSPDAEKDESSGRHPTEESSGGHPTEESSGRHPSKILFGLFRSRGGGLPDVCPLTRAALRAGSTRQNPIRLHHLASGWFCLRGFDDHGPPLRIILTGPLPEKTQQVKNLDPIKDPAGYTYWAWSISVVLKPIGDYRIHVTQDSKALGILLQASGRVKVVPATVPSIYNARETASYPPGTTLQIELSGFRPNSQVMIFVYGPLARVGKSYGYPFLRPLPLAQMDAHGEASYLLASRPGDQPGEYAVWINPTPLKCHGRMACTRFKVKL